MGQEHITKITQLQENRFLNFYDMDFKDRDGNDRKYYFCSHNKKEDLQIYRDEVRSEGVCVYAVTDEKEPRLVVIREYRLPTGKELYACPAGRIDPGETPSEAAVREMREETGLVFTEYTEGFAGFRRPFFLVPGVSDEPNNTLFGTVKFAEAAERKAELEATEWIRVMYATKEQVKEILQEGQADTRGAYLMMLYLNSDPKDPMSFLHV